MLTFERTSDYDLVRQIATHPKIYKFISDDKSPAAEDYRPIESDAIHYVLVKDGVELLGMWVFMPLNGVTAEIHTCLLPNAWGPRAKTAAQMLARWVWQNTEFLRVITNVPSHNKLALHFAQRAGLVQFGINHRSYMKDGSLQDQIMLGASRPKEYDLCR